MSEPLLRASGLAKAYRGGVRAVEVLRGLDLEVAEGETVAIVGDSGVGKSTLLHLLGGLDRPDDGTLWFRGVNLAERGHPAQVEYRNHDVGFVFQQHHLLAEFTAVENVEMPLRIGRRDDGARRGAIALLQGLGLGERLGHRPAELSGGEQQRVAIARAVVTRPALVLADEPTGNLDPATGRQVFEVLRGLQRDRRFALLLVTHNERLAGGCDRVLRLLDGRLWPLGEAETRAYFAGLGTRGAADPML